MRGTRASGGRPVGATRTRRLRHGASDRASAPDSGRASGQAPVRAPVRASVRASVRAGLLSAGLLAAPAAILPTLAPILTPFLAPTLAPALAIAIPLAGPLFASAARAQEIPPAGRSIRDATRERPPEARPLDAAAPDIRFTSQTPPANAREITFRLTGVSLSGGSVYAPGALDAEFADLLGATVSVADVFGIAARIQRRYRDDGYLFTRVIVPAQDIDDGVVRLEVIEAYIESVEIEEPGAPLGSVRALAEAYAAKLRGLRNPTQTQVERALLLLNDIPGVQRAAAVPKLGEGGRGAIRLFINMERDPYDASLFVDNRQSPVVGRGLLGAVASANSYSAAGDSTSVFAFMSGGFDDPFPEDFEERWTVQVEHGRFIGDDGLSLRARALYSESHPGDVLTPFGIENKQGEAEIALRYPWIRTRALSLDVGGGFELSEIDTYVPNNNDPLASGFKTADDSLRVLFARGDLLQRDARGFTSATLEARVGLPILGASSAGDAGLSRPDADGEFLLLRGRIERTLSVWGPVVAWAQATGQWSNGPLLSHEEFAVGGADLGRAFDPSEYTGDLGLGVVAELRYPTQFAFDGMRMSSEFYVYGDWAEVRNLDGAKPVHRAVTSAGFGLRALLPNDFALNLEAAKPLNRELQRNQSGDWRFFVSASKRF